MLVKWGVDDDDGGLHADNCHQVSVVFTRDYSPHATVFSYLRKVKLLVARCCILSLFRNVICRKISTMHGHRVAAGNKNFSQVRYISLNLLTIVEMKPSKT